MMGGLTEKFGIDPLNGTRCYRQATSFQQGAQDEDVMQDGYATTNEVEAADDPGEARTACRSAAAAAAADGIVKVNYTADAQADLLLKKWWFEMAPTICSLPAEARKSVAAEVNCSLHRWQH